MFIIMPLILRKIMCKLLMITEKARHKCLYFPCDGIKIMRYGGKNPLGIMGVQEEFGQKFDN